MVVQVNVLDDNRPQLADVVLFAAILASFPRCTKANAGLSISHLAAVSRRFFYSFLVNPMNDLI